MEWNWLWGLFYGIIGGLFEFLPASSLVHQKMLLKLAGLDMPGYGMSLALHLGALGAVVLSYFDNLSKMNRERKIASITKRHRRRQSNVVTLMQLKLLKVASVPVVITCLLSPWLISYLDRAWIMILGTVLCGVVVLLPHYMSWANKDARSMSPLDAVLIGFGGALGVLPGFSRAGTLTAVASMRGTDRKYAIDFVCIMLVPALAALAVGDLGMILFSGDPQAGILFLPGVFACLGAFGAGLAGIRLMRFLAVRSGYESLAYYNWGLAMFTFVVYLIG